MWNFCIEYKSGLIKRISIYIWRDLDPKTGEFRAGNFADPSREFHFKCPKCGESYELNREVMRYKKHWEIRMQARLKLFLCCKCARNYKKEVTK